MNDSLLLALNTVLVIAGVIAEVHFFRCFVNDWLRNCRERWEHSGRRARPSLPEARLGEQRSDTFALAAILIGGVLPAAHAMRQDGVKDVFVGSVKLDSSTSLSLQEFAAGADTSAGTTLTPASESAPLAISTDRPSFSDGSGIVPVGRFQLETGYTFTFRNRDGAKTQRHNGPEVLARVGLVDDRVELRLITNGYVWSRTDDGSGDGFASSPGWSDVGLGLKFKMFDQNGWVPRVAIGAQTTLGAGSDSASSQTAEPTLKLIWSYDLEPSLGDDWKGFTMGGNANIAWPTTNGDRFTQGQGSVYLSFPLADRLSGFVEYYVIGPSAKGADAAHYVDVGAALLLSDRIQLDARVGFGLNQASDNVYCGFGLSVLF